MAARQLEVITNTTAAEVNLPTVKRSPPVGASFTDSLEGTVGVATHHDGMSGTERQSVTDDYAQRISERLRLGGCKLDVTRHTLQVTSHK